MKKSFREYMAQYAAEHTHPGTRATHLVGIPMIVFSLPLLPFAPPAGVALFAGGWLLQLVGHAVFEKRRPSFFEDPLYLLIGVIWWAVEVGRLLGIEIPVPGAAGDEVAQMHASFAASAPN